MKRARQRLALPRRPHRAASFLVISPAVDLGQAIDQWRNVGS
jgi:hypothetical protein